MGRDLSTKNFHQWCKNTGGESSVERTGPKEHTHKCLLRDEGVVHKIVDNEKEVGATYLVEGSVGKTTSLPLPEFNKVREAGIDNEFNITEIKGITGVSLQGKDRLKILGGEIGKTIRYKPDLEGKNLGEYTVSL